MRALYNNRRARRNRLQCGIGYATAVLMSTSRARPDDSPARPDTLLRAAAKRCAGELDAVNRVIESRLSSDIALIKTLGSHLIAAGGKRLRPLVLLLCAKACGYRGAHHVLLGAVIEFIHTATLLHDDVVDASAMRRGKSTANHVWGNQASVLVGDFLYSRAFEMMLETDKMEVMQILATTTNTIAEGEVMQLANVRNADTAEQTYLDTVHRKTAKLFESAAQLGALLADACPDVRDAFASYGRHLGVAFQLTDDVLDYTADSAQLGKNVGDDLAEGKPTLPLIYALGVGAADQQQTIRRAIENGDRAQLQQILAIVESTGALAYTTTLAKREADLATQSIDALDASPDKDALMSLAEFAVLRAH